MSTGDTPICSEAPGLKKALNSKLPLLRVIPTVTHYSAIVSDVSSGRIYIYTYIVPFYLTFFVANTLIFYLTFFGILSYYSDILSGISSDILSSVLSGILFRHLFWHSIWQVYSDILSGKSILPFYWTCILTFCLALCPAFSLACVSRRGPQHLELGGEGVRKWHLC